MSSPLTLHAAPSAGFEAPFELLLACHERVRRSLRLLLRLGAHLAEGGDPAQARDAAADVRRYFEVAAPLHHEDEARHLFPLLQAQGAAALAQRLAAEHERMDAAWPAVRADLDALVDERFDAAGLPAARGRWAAFAALYDGHIAAEEGEAYPFCRARLDAAALAAIGAEMAGRRGVAVVSR